MDELLNKLWCGVGVAWSMRALVNSTTLTIGRLYCIGDPPDAKRHATVEIADLGFGLGIGASLGMVLMIGVNYEAPLQMREKLEGFSDIDFSLDIGLADTRGLKPILTNMATEIPKGSLIKLLQTLKSGGHVKENYQWSSAFGEAIAKDTQATGFDWTKKRIITLSIPGCGLGLEAYLGVKGTDTTIMSWGTSDMRSVKMTPIRSL